MLSSPSTILPVAGFLDVPSLGDNGEKTREPGWIRILYGLGVLIIDDCREDSGITYDIEDTDCIQNLVRKTDLEENGDVEIEKLISCLRTYFIPDCNTWIIRLDYLDPPSSK